MRFPTLALALVLACCPTAALAQELVPNPSFEQASSCPFANGQIAFADPWVSPTVASTDYFNPCDTTPDNVGVPDNAVGTQEAYEGSSYAGFIALAPPMGNPEYREYMQAQLLSPLDAGKTYRFVMHFSLAEDSSAATDRIGAHLSTTPIGSSDYLYLPYTPQFETPAGTFLTDYVEWYTLSDTFVASGGEEWLTIGNFHDYAGSGSVPAGLGPAPPLQMGIAYYYVDVVSLTCQECVHPPDDMLAWWPLDETTGGIAVDLVYALNGGHVGGPTPVPGQVAGALGFLGSGVSVPTAPQLELGTFDFSFELWIRPDALGTTQAVLAKVPPLFTGPGYGLAVNPDGSLTFTMVDDALDVATGSTAPVLAAGEWSYVVVAVDRDDPSGGRIHVDETVATFDPTAADGSLTNALDLRFAQDGGAGLGGDLAGTLDEVGLYGRALFSYEVDYVYETLTSGKCKDVFELPPITPVTAVPVGDPPVITTTGTLTNGGGLVGTYDVTVRGDPAGTRYANRRTRVAGPQRPRVVTPLPLQVPPGASVPVRLELDLPPDLVWGLATYTVTVTHLETGRTFSARSGLVRPPREATMQPR